MAFGTKSVVCSGSSCRKRPRLLEDGDETLLIFHLQPREALENLSETQSYNSQPAALPRSRLKVILRGLVIPFLLFRLRGVLLLRQDLAALVEAVQQGQDAHLLPEHSVQLGEVPVLPSSAVDRRAAKRSID